MSYNIFLMHFFKAQKNLKLLRFQDGFGKLKES